MLARNKSFLILLFTALLATACSDDDGNGPSVEAPEYYTFTREGETTVAFSGQTARIKMATEINNNLKNFDLGESAETTFLEMFRNATAAGSNADPFEDDDLNAETKSVKEKIATSTDYFAANTSESAAIKDQFEDWFSEQATVVFPNEEVAAEAGVAGQIGINPRYVNGDGLELNQVIIKSFMGALMADQILNNYLSPAVLDAGSNRTDNEAGTLVEGKNYTNMEHKWDEAYGYLFGMAPDPTDPLATLGSDDRFLNSYTNQVNNDEDFEGIAEAIFNAFKLGRAAIIAGNYTVRDQQANIIKEAISTVLAVRAVHYMQAGKVSLEADNPDYGNVFHALSEGYGFLYSLRFSRKPGTNTPYLSKTEVDGLLADLMGDGENGLWDVKTSTLDNISNTIASKFNFTVTQAAE